MASTILKKHFTIGNLVLLAFVVGGFYYTVPEAIEGNKEQIEAISETSKINRKHLDRIERNYVDRDALDDYVKSKEIVNLRNYVGQRMDRIEDQLDILIKDDKNN